MEALSISEDEGSPVRRRTTTSRRKKSAAQIEFLERLYAENKYPSEEVRAKLSAQLGLSEKQMQIWFTHRRHKDRKDGVEDVKLTFYAMRHKGGEAHLDFMEELNSGKRVGGSLLGREDTSPNGGHQQLSYSGGETSNGPHNRRTDSESENSGLGEADEFNVGGFRGSVKRGNSGGRKDPGYKRPMILPPRAKIGSKALERSVISAVESQLGSSIRMDGPHLAMEFDSLPPDAWARLADVGASISPVPVQARGPVSNPISMQGRGGRMQSIGTY